MITWKDFTNLRIFNQLRLKKNATIVVERTDGTTNVLNVTEMAKIDGITNGTGQAGKAVVLDANLDHSGVRNWTISGTMAHAGIETASGGEAPTVFHTGQVGPVATTTGTDKAAVVTETYVAEVFVPVDKTLTGVKVLLGSATAGAAKASLASGTAGTILASSATTTVGATAAYTTLPFTSTYAAKGPMKYYVQVQFNSTSCNFRAHAVGAFNAGKLTGQTFGTMPAATMPSTFTADLGPIADVY